MSGKFNGLPDESDPLLGAAGRPFSVPREDGCPDRVPALPQFITVRGGAYFFLPGLRALQYFARGRAAGRFASSANRPPEGGISS
jgi:hypothetical protein